MNYQLQNILLTIDDITQMITRAEKFINNKIIISKFIIY